ncbi:hypothetical protein AOLI_G00181680 [Acnodon oligacanthus]
MTCGAAGTTGQDKNPSDLLSLLFSTGRDTAMSSLPEAMRSLTQVFTGKLQDFTDEVENVHMLWLEEIQQEAQRMFSSDFSTEPELMPKTPSQKKTSRRKRVSVELNENRSKRRFSKGKRSNLRRSSVQNTLNSISELVVSHAPSNSPDTVAEEPVRRTRRNKAAAADSEPVKRSTRNKGAAKAKEQVEVMEEEAVEVAAVADAPEPTDVPENVLEVKESSSSSSPVQTLTSEAVVKIPSAERLSANKLLGSGPSPGRSANKITIAAAGAQPSSRTSVRRSLVLRRSLVGLRHSMTQEAVRRASRRSFLKKKARLGNSTCSSSVSGDVSMDVEMEENEVVMENRIEQMLTEEETAEPAAEASTEAPITQPGDPESKRPVEDKALMPNEEVKPITPTSGENCRFTRSMAQLSETDDIGKKSQDDVRASRSASKRRAAESAAIALSTPKKKHSPPKKCMTGITPSMRFLHTVQKNQLLMMTPSSLGRSSFMKSFIKQTGKTDIKERERQKWDALNKKIEQENERKKKMEEDRRKKQEEMKRKRDERLKRVVEARVKGEMEKEQEKKKKIEEKMAQIEKKNDMLRVERLAEEKAKKKVATKRQEELELRRKQEEAARKKKLQQQAEEEERRHQELLAKRKAEEEREKARKQAEAARALELKKEQERERERERQAAAERERVEREKAIALQKELDRAAKEKERRELEDKRRREEEQRRAEEERAAQQKHAAAAVAPTVTTSLMKMPITKTLNATITHSPALNVTVDIEHSVMKTPVSKGAANMTIDKGAGLNVTVDVEQSPQSYQITPKGKKVDVLVNPEDYGMDQNSDDSTDDESAPRKPIPSWAEGMQLQQAIMKRYYDPLDLDSYFGEIEQPRLEKIFQKTKPRFFKRTSSAVWHSPPRMVLKELGRINSHWSSLSDQSPHLTDVRIEPSGDLLNTAGLSGLRRGFYTGEVYLISVHNFIRPGIAARLEDRAALLPNYRDDSSWSGVHLPGFGGFSHGKTRRSYPGRGGNPYPQGGSYPGYPVRGASYPGSSPNQYGGVAGAGRYPGEDRYPYWNPNNKIISPRYGGNFGHGGYGYAGAGGSPFAQSVHNMGMRPSIQSKGFGRQAVMAAGVGAVAGMALGYGLGSFPRPHFAFHSPQEEYYYNHYMYRRYGTRPSDSNTNPGSPGGGAGDSGSSSTGSEVSNAYNIFQNPPPQSYDTYMDRCMNRTDLLRGQQAGRSKRAVEDTQPLRASDSVQGGDPNITQGEKPAGAAGFSEAQVSDSSAQSESPGIESKSANSTDSPLPVAAKLTGATEPPPQPREDREEDDTVSIMEIGYPALIEQLKARRCIELYMAYAEHHAQKQIQDRSSGDESFRGGGEQPRPFSHRVILVLSSTISLIISSLLLH